MPWHRCQPYIVGIALGMILHVTKNTEVKMKRVRSVRTTESDGDKNQKRNQTKKFLPSVVRSFNVGLGVCGRDWRSLRAGSLGLLGDARVPLRGRVCLLQRVPQNGLGNGLGLDDLCLLSRIRR